MHLKSKETITIFIIEEKKICILIIMTYYVTLVSIAILFNHSVGKVTLTRLVLPKGYPIIPREHHYIV